MGKRIVFVDEIAFTKTTLSENAFSNLRSNLELPGKLVAQEAIYMVMAVSRDFGFEGSRIFNKPLDSEMFCEILADILKNGRNCVVFADNATIHTSSLTKKAFDNENIPMMYNLPYCPALNPIEMVFS